MKITIRNFMALISCIRITMIKCFVPMNCMKSALSIITISLGAVHALSAQSITIPIETKNVAVVMQTDAKKRLKIIYTGRKLPATTGYTDFARKHQLSADGGSSCNNAFAVAGIDNNFSEPAIAVVHADGNNSLDLQYEKNNVVNTPDGATLTTITLKDPVYPFYVELFFKAWKDQDVIEQWSSFKHAEKKAVVLNKYASANLYLFDNSFYLTSYNGTWAGEMQRTVSQLQQGMHTIQSRLGTRENIVGSPNFMLALDKQATETSGTVMMGQIAWNGNYAIQFETDINKKMHIVAGINPYQSAYHLSPNTTFETPKFVYTISFDGMGTGSRNLQTWLRNFQLLEGKGERLTLLNNWEATGFNFNQEQLAGLFKGAKDIGVDLFLLDDGWFGNKYPRNSDKAGLGDWQENTSKLPDGIPYLVKNAEKLGVKFGIWIEPEMINPKSELYEKHLDWVLRQEKRPEFYYRSQMVLDLTNPDVQHFVFGIVDNLFKQNPTLAFIKWDCNAPILNGHSTYLERRGIPQSHLYVEYSLGLKKVLERIRAKYPAVPMMLCSGGGGRSDYGLLQYFTEFWPSDNTDPLARAFMQWNYSYYYPAIATCNHVTNWGKQPLKYKIDVASMGKLGFDIKVDELSPADIAFCRQAVQTYNGFKDVVWHGDMYRLKSPYESEMASLMFLDKNRSEGVVFNYLTNWKYTGGPSDPVKLQGLDPDKKYRVKELNVYDPQKRLIDESKTYTGAALMQEGIQPGITAERTSVVLSITAIQ